MRMMYFFMSVSIKTWEEEGVGFTFALCQEHRASFLGEIRHSTRPTSSSRATVEMSTLLPRYRRCLFLIILSFYFLS